MSWEVALPPDWINIIAEIYQPISIASALLILADILIAGRRQPMSIMNAVWPLTMLYWGPLGLIFYFWFGRAKASQHRGSHGADRRHASPPMWQSAFKGATHCGAGCALGDFAGEWLAFATSFTILGSSLTGRFAMSLMFAYVLGIGFQYLSIVPMLELRPREGVIAAIKVDTLSLLAY